MTVAASGNTSSAIVAAAVAVVVEATEMEAMIPATLTIVRGAITIAIP